MMDNSETTKAFLELLTLTLSMNRYGDREYYAPVSELPENGEDIPDFENGDITYFVSGKSLAIFFGNEGNSSQGGLIRMGKNADIVTMRELVPEDMTFTHMSGRQQTWEEYLAVMCLFAVCGYYAVGGAALLEKRRKRT